MIKLVAAHIFEVFDGQAQGISGKKKEKNRERQGVQAVFGRNGEKTCDENEKTGESGEHRCQKREAFEAERRGGIQPGQRLIAEQEKQGRKTHDAGENERGDEKESPESFVEFQRESVLNEWAKRVGLPIDLGVVAIIDDDRGEPGAFDCTEQDDCAQDMEEIKGERCLGEK